MLPETKLFHIFVTLVNYIMESKEIITAPKIDAITSSDVVDKPSICGAFNSTTMKLIKLSKNQSVMVDNWNYDYLNQWKWDAKKGKYTYYAERKSRINGKCVTIRMHRVIMNTPKGYEVDHKDWNGLNCLESNMRNCTHSQNCMNRRAHGRSKYLGVCYETRKYKNKTYEYISAQIKTNGKVRKIGFFKTEESAARAYNQEAIKYFGEFANLNKFNNE